MVHALRVRWAPALTVFGAVLAGGCAGSGPTVTAGTPAEAGPPPYAKLCAAADGPPPSELVCTGLYDDIATKTLAAGVRPFAPAVGHWQDGARAQRWILLPAGTKIDATDPNEWMFPVGTRLWQEWSRDGRRVETRYLQKADVGFWVHATYQWEAGESGATLTGGGDIPWDYGETYHIPSDDECERCHRGRTDGVLGFEQVLLGLPGASGLTLAVLAAERLIQPLPLRTELTIGDDGTGAAAAPLVWLHANCGVACHNGNSNATAYAVGQRLRLDPTLLDGRPSSSLDPIATTVNVAATSATFTGTVRISPGDPGNSLLARLILNRQVSDPDFAQMPPIDSLLVDERDTETVVAWISRMPK